MVLQKQGSTASGVSDADTEGGAPQENSLAQPVDKEAEKAKGELAANKQSKVVTGLFGLLYTLAKEKYSDSWKIAITNVITDFMFLIVIFLNLEYPWHVEEGSLWLYHVFYYIEIHKPLAVRGGYMTFLVVFYILMAMLFVCVSICFWVAWGFTNDNFPYIWPIKFVRIFVSFFFGTFYIASLNIFLTMLECGSETGTWLHEVWHKECMEVPHLVHAIMSVIACATFAGVTFLLVMADHDLNPMSKSLLSSPHSLTELKSLAVKTVITAADVLLFSRRDVQVVIFALATIYNMWIFMTEIPYYNAWINALRTGFYSVHAWVCLMLVILVYRVESTVVSGSLTHHIVHDIKDPELSRKITSGMAFGIIPAFFVGGLIAFLRQAYFFKKGLRFKDFHQGVKSRLIAKFNNSFEVEIASRVDRVWDEDGNLDAAALDLGEAVLKGGIQQFPKCPFMRICYSSFLIDCRQQQLGGSAQLELARKMYPNLSFRFSIFTREQEHKQKAVTSGSGESASDLVAYVAFQRNYKMLLQYHRAAVLATRNFWRLLLRSSVDLVQLTLAFRRIDHMEDMADITYKMVLKRYPNAVKLLRSYGKFLEQVKNDPWTAARYYAEADKQEEAAENNVQELHVDDEGKPIAGLDPNAAIVTINSSGIIQLANKHAFNMFGYKRGELEGKNVSCLMPQPFSGRHNSYLQNYVETDKAKILNSDREVVGLHKQRYVFPIIIHVTKISGAAADSIFLGVLKPVVQDSTTVRAWLMPNGAILCVDQGFMDYAGWAVKDLLGKSFEMLSSKEGQLSNLVNSAAASTTAELEAGMVQAHVMIRHKYADDVPVHLKMGPGGTEDQRLFVAVMRRTGPSEGMAIFDHRGRIEYVNNHFATMLGRQPEEMVHLEMHDIMPQPFGLMHPKWMKDQEQRPTRPPPSSCRAGVVQTLLSANGAHVHARLKMSIREMGDNFSHIVKAEKVLPNEYLADRCLHLHVNELGQIVWASKTPKVLFNFEGESCVGKSVVDIVDVLQAWQAEGNDPLEALGAFLIQSLDHPGSTWRVSIVPQLTKEQLAKEQEKGTLQRQLSHRDSYMSSASNAQDPFMLNRGPKVKPAIMQVGQLEMDGEKSAEPLMSIKLWRPESVTCVAEVDENLSVVKCDPAASLLFGISHADIVQRPITNVLKLPKGASLGLMFGAANASADANSMKPAVKARGGRGHSVVVGPRRTVEAVHADRKMLQVSMQAAARDSSRKRGLLVLKPTNPMSFLNLDVLRQLLSDDAPGNQVEDLEAMPSNDFRDDQYGDEQGPVTARGINLDLGGLNSARPHLSDSPRSREEGLLTARDIGISLHSDDSHRRHQYDPQRQDSDGSHGLSSQHSHGSLSQHKAPSPTGSGRCLSATRLSHTPSPLGINDSSKPTNKALANVLKDSPQGSNVSSGDGSGSTQHMSDDSAMMLRAGGRAKLVQERARLQEQLHQRQDAPDILPPRKQGGLKKASFDEGSIQTDEKKKKGRRASFELPGEETTKPGMNGLPIPDPGREPTDQGPKGSYDATAPSTLSLQKLENVEKGLKSGEASHDDSERSEKDDDQHTNFSRGKRLKSLLNLLAGKQAVKTLRGLKWRVWAVVGSMVALHVVLFIVVIVLTSQQSAYISNVERSGEGIELMHIAATYSRAIESAFRGGNAFTLQDDVPKFKTSLLDLIVQFEVVHEGLHLGFENVAVAASSSDKLAQLWDEENRDTIVHEDNADPTTRPNTVIEQHSLWNLGNMLVANGRQVVRIAEEAISGDISSADLPHALSNSRFWLFIHDNVHRALYEGYVEVANTVMVEGLTKVQQLETLLVALLVVEVVLAGVGATGYAIHLFRNVARARCALFSVFLVIPSRILKSLSTTHVDVDDPDASDAEEGEAGAGAGAKAVESAKDDGADNMSAYSRQTSLDKQSVTRDDMTSRDGSMRDFPRSLVNFAPAGASPTISGRHNLSGKSNNSGSSPGKKLSKTNHDVIKLVVPFFLWTVLLLGVYLGSWSNLATGSRDLIHTNMVARTRGQTMRTLFFATELTLGDPSFADEREAMQVSVAEEGALLNRLYLTTLYGGPFLDKDMVSGAPESVHGILFLRESIVDLLFYKEGCLRGSHELYGPCLDGESPLFETSANGADTIVRRQVRESELLSLDAMEDVNHENDRWQFMWALVRLDLREAMAEVSNLYVTDSLEVYTGQLVLHVVILVAMLVLVTLYMWMLFLPFLRHTITESHRVAELLTQLPEEANVEAMMEVSWQAVKNDMEIKASENSRLFRRAKPEELTNRISKSFAGARKSFSDFRERVSKSFSLDVVKKPPGRPSRDSAHMSSNKVAPVDTGKAAVDLLPTEQGAGEDGERHLGRVLSTIMEGSVTGTNDGTPNPGVLGSMAALNSAPSMGTDGAPLEATYPDAAAVAAAALGTSSLFSHGGQRTNRLTDPSADAGPPPHPVTADGNEAGAGGPKEGQNRGKEGDQEEGGDQEAEGDKGWGTSALESMTSFDAHIQKLLAARPPQLNASRLSMQSRARASADLPVDAAGSPAGDSEDNADAQARTMEQVHKGSVSGSFFARPNNGSASGAAEAGTAAGSISSGGSRPVSAAWPDPAAPLSSPQPTGVEGPTGSGSIAGSRPNSANLGPAAVPSPPPAGAATDGDAAAPSPLPAADAVDVATTSPATPPAAAAATDGDATAPSAVPAAADGHGAHGSRPSSTVAAAPAPAAAAAAAPAAARASPSLDGTELEGSVSSSDAAAAAATAATEEEQGGKGGATEKAVNPAATDGRPGGQPHAPSPVPKLDLARLRAHDQTGGPPPPPLNAALSSSAGRGLTAEGQSSTRMDSPHAFVQDAEQGSLAGGLAAHWRGASPPKPRSRPAAPVEENSSVSSGTSSLGDLGSSDEGGPPSPGKVGGGGGGGGGDGVGVGGAAAAAPPAALADEAAPHGDGGGSGASGQGAQGQQQQQGGRGANGAKSRATNDTAFDSGAEGSSYSGSGVAPPHFGRSTLLATQGAPNANRYPAVPSRLGGTTPRDLFGLESGKRSSFKASGATTARAPATATAPGVTPPMGAASARGAAPTGRSSLGHSPPAPAPAGRHSLDSRSAAAAKPAVRPRKAFGTPRVPEEVAEEPQGATGPATQEPSGLTEAAVGPRGTSPAGAPGSAPGSAGGSSVSSSLRAFLGRQQSQLHSSNTVDNNTSANNTNTAAAHAAEPSAPEAPHQGSVTDRPAAVAPPPASPGAKAKGSATDRSMRSSVTANAAAAAAAAAAARTAGTALAAGAHPTATSQGSLSPPNLLQPLAVTLRQRREQQQAGSHRQGPGRSSLNLPHPTQAAAAAPLHPGPGRFSLSLDPRSPTLHPPPHLPTSGLPASTQGLGAPSHAHTSPTAAHPPPPVIPLSVRSSVMSAAAPPPALQAEHPSPGAPRSGRSSVISSSAPPPPPLQAERPSPGAPLSSRSSLISAPPPPPPPEERPSPGVPPSGRSSMTSARPAPPAAATASPPAVAGPPAVSPPQPAPAPPEGLSAAIAAANAAYAAKFGGAKLGSQATPSPPPHQHQQQHTSPPPPAVPPLQQQQQQPQQPRVRTPQAATNPNPAANTTAPNMKLEGSQGSDLGLDLENTESWMAAINDMDSEEEGRV